MQPDRRRESGNYGGPIVIDGLTGFKKTTEEGSIVKAAIVVGILLIVLGVAGLTYGRISYTSHEKAADIGPLQVNVAEKHRVAIPPVLAVVSLVGGVVLVAVGARGRR